MEKVDINAFFLENEEAVYNIKLFRSIERIEEIGILTTSIKREKNFKVVNTAQIFLKDIVEKTVVCLNSDFQPYFYESHIISPKGNITVTCEFQKNKYIIKVVSLHKVQEVKLPRATNYFENTSAIYLFRLIAFKAIPIKELYIVNLNYATKTFIKVETIEEEITKCNLGEVLCCGVKVSFPEHPSLPVQKFLYKKEKPYYLIKNIAGEQIIEITEIGGKDDSL